MINRYDYSAPSPLTEFSREEFSSKTSAPPTDEMTSTLEVRAPIEPIVRKAQSLFEMGPAGRSGLTDVSIRHDDYLYREE